MDHDQRIKVLVRTFFAWFFSAFLPYWRSQFDFDHVEWVDKEVFPNPPQGQMRTFDLLARLHVVGDARFVVGGPELLPTGEGGSFPDDVEANRAESAVAPDAANPDTWLTLVHTEIVGERSRPTTRRMMFQDFAYLWWKFNTPVLPIALFIDLGLEGVGSDSLVVRYGDTQLLHFRYLYVALKSHDAAAFAQGDNPLAAALVGLMKCGNKRAEIKVWAADTIRRSETTEWEKYLLLDCLDAYLTLNRNETVQYESMLATEPYQETKTVIQSVFDKARAEGRQEGREEGMRSVCLELLRKRFQATSDVVAPRLQRLSSAELADLALRILDAESLESLGLSERG